MSSFVARWSVLIVGIVAIVVGSVMVAMPQSSFAWYAYAPASDLAFVPLYPLDVAGLIIVGTGLTLVAGWVGFRLSRLLGHQR